MASKLSKPTVISLKPFSERHAKGRQRGRAADGKKTAGGKKTVFSLLKSHGQTSFWEPLELGHLVVKRAPRTARCELYDGKGLLYASLRARTGARFRVRGATGSHCAKLLSPSGGLLGKAEFSVRAHTRILCSKSPYGELARRVENLLLATPRRRWMLRGKPRLMFVGWGRDHVHTLKAMKFFEADVTSGLDYWLETQEPNGMFWDCLHGNPTGTAPCWFGEALGDGFFRYEEDGRIIVRRIPVEADCEFLYAEGVWQAWKASGDDDWMRLQIPRLEKALRYNTSHRDRWSRRHGLVRRSFCMDSWDFANPHFCAGDKRRLNPGDPQFLFHGDNSGLYSFYRRLAEMHDCAGNIRRAGVLRAAAAGLRLRANSRLFFGRTYGHMIPEKLEPQAVYDLVGDERKRLSLSLGYTINRGLPTHAMSVKILREFRSRGHRKARSNFAEWFAMDPPYTEAQWPGCAKEGAPPGDYMNGGISPIVAGELARAAFEHGMEEYGADILRRVWDLTERDGGRLHDTYVQAPRNPVLPRAQFCHLDLRSAANRGLRHGACPGVTAWTGEGDNDMRGLPVGHRKFGVIRFDVISPGANSGRAVVHLPPNACADIPARGVCAKSLYFLHAFSGTALAGETVAVYDIKYEDGTSAEVAVGMQREVAGWWNPTWPGAREPSHARIAWRGPNPQWRDVGVTMFGWNNPDPEKPICRVHARSLRGDFLLLAISASDQPVAFEARIRSGGIPECWAHAAVYHAIAEGLAGVVDEGRAFDRVCISPRWAATGARQADVCLHYPASDACCAYSYKHDPRRKRITLEFAGDFGAAALRCLLPSGCSASEVVEGKRPLTFKRERVGNSSYVCFELAGAASSPVVIRLVPSSR